MSFSAPKLKLVKITDNISASLPQDFKVMPDDAIATKYPSHRKPLGAFTSPNGQIDFITSERPITFKKEDTKMLKDFYKSSITNTFSEVTFIRDEIKAKIKTDAPMLTNLGNIINTGIHEELDELRKIAFSGKDYLLQLQQKEARRTGISSLKIA